MDGIQFAVVSVEVKKCLDEVWPLILQATVLDAVPAKFKTDDSLKLSDEDSNKIMFLSGHSMVRLEAIEFHFLWGLSQLIMFQGQQLVSDMQAKMFFAADEKRSGVSVPQGTRDSMTSCDIALPVLQSLVNESFFNHGFLSSELCTELLQVKHHIYSISGKQTIR